MYIQRDIERRIAELTRQFFVLILTGPRQVGKTTLLERVSQSAGDNRTVITLDDLEIRAFARTDPKGFLTAYPPPLLIDEVQYAPELFNYLKMEVDRRQTEGDYWLTGSQSYRLMQGVSESLAGRIGILQLGAMSQNELYNHFTDPGPSYTMLEAQSRADALDPPTRDEFIGRILKGGMPRVQVVDKLDLRVYFDSYVKSYLERDVRYLEPQVSSAGFLKFLHVVAARNTQLLNVEGIARDAQLSAYQTRAWLEILETLGIIYYVSSYSNNLLSRTVKAPKLYFFDTGLVCHLLEIHSVKALQVSQAFGALYENYLVNQLSLARTNSAVAGDVYYYRDYDAREIDWVEVDEESLHPIEIKATNNPSSHLARSFRVLDKGSVARGRGAVISMSSEVRALDSRTITLPAWCL
ncbi:MAG: ATP-binding protein [Coriobacteriia bacterium]|nr:ATP-binding protein [Coriobacteriia bacterium]